MTNEDRLRLVSDGHGFLEGPRWRDGGLFVSDFFEQRVLRFAADDSVEVVCDFPGRPSGLGWDRNGDLLAVSMLDRALIRFDGTEFVTVADLTGLFAWYANDMATHERGDSYVGNFGWDDTSSDAITPTVIARVDQEGRVDVAAEDVVFPNGMVIIDDGSTLLVAETFAARITAFDIDEDGRLGGRRVWADLSGGRTFGTLSEALDSGACLPDGIAIHHDGTLWVADAARQGVLHVAEGGSVIDVVGVPDGQTAFAVAVGGDDLDRLYVCAADPYGQGDPSRVRRSRLYVMDL